MRMLALLGVMMAAFFPCSVANASFNTGNDLYAKCSAVKSEATYYQDSAYCLAYVIGIVDAFEFNEGVKSGLKLCVPGGVTAGQLRDIVVRYLQNKPQDRHNAGSVIIFLAMSEAFPCQNGQ